MKFYAPIWNITDCVLKIRFPAPIRVRAWRTSAFLRFVESVDAEEAILLGNSFSDYSDPDRPRTMYVAVADATPPDHFRPAEKNQDSTSAFRHFETLASQLGRHLSLLHLFDRGDAFVPLWFVAGPLPRRVDLLASAREFSHHAPGLFHVDSLLMPELRTFLRDISLPLRPDYVDLAFQHFETTFTVADERLRFLSLMIALEILLNADRNELRYRVSRNLAVLIGRSPKDSASVFQEAKRLYDIRSSLVHTGRAAALTYESLHRLESLVRGALLRLARLQLTKDVLLERLNASGFGRFRGDV